MTLHKADNGDVDLYLGDGLINDLGTTLNYYCLNNGPKCETSVRDVLESGDYELQSRQIGVVAAVGGAILSMFAFQIYEFWRVDQSKPVPPHFNLRKKRFGAPCASLIAQALALTLDVVAATLVSSVTANPSATDIVIKTGSGDSGVDVAVTSIPASSATSTINRATLATGIVVSTATGSANGHNSGDYLFHFSDQSPDPMRRLEFGSAKRL